MIRILLSGWFRLILILFSGGLAVLLFFNGKSPLLRAGAGNFTISSNASEIASMILAVLCAGIILMSCVLYISECFILRKTIRICSEPEIISSTNIPPIPRWLSSSIIRKFRRIISQAFSKTLFIDTLIESIPNAVLLCDIKGRIILSNKTAEMILCSESDLRGMSIDYIFPRSIQDKQFDAMISKDGGFSSFYWQSYCGGEDTIPVFINMRTINLEDEPFMLVIITDLSETQKAYDDLDFNTALLDNAFDPIIAHKSGGVIAYANRAACELYQYSPDDMIVMNAEDLVFPTSLREYRDQISKLKYTKRSESEIWHKRKNGTFIATLTACATVPSKNGELVIETHHDLSEVKRNQNALRESEERFRTFFDNAKDCVMIITANGSILNINNSGKNMLGITNEDPTELDFFSMFYDQSQLDLFKADLSASGSSRDYQADLRKLSGTIVPIEINASYFHNPVYHISGYNVFARDLTMVRSMEIRMRQAHKLDAIGRLAGGIAHDFNNILTVIIGNTELALFSTEKESDLYEPLTQIKESAERAANLTGQLLAFGRKQQVLSVVMDPNEVIHDLAKMLHRLIGDEIRLEINTDKSAGSIKADKNQFEQVLINLVLNARDAVMEKKDGERKITIETSKTYLDSSYAAKHPEHIKGPNSVIKITDTGIGIPYENIDKIYDPFFTTKSPEKGSGLGLSTVFGILSQHNARIFVESREGGPTSFEIHWPSSEGTAEETAQLPSDDILTTGDETILIVEDELSLCQFTAAALRRKGYAPIEARSYDEALNAARDRKDIALAFIDIAIPGKNGIECAKELRNIQPNIKILFTSGYPDNYTRCAEEIHGVRYIHKPYNISALARIIRQMID
jgi:PAS domain S-box-containing protein